MSNQKSQENYTKLQTARLQTLIDSAFSDKSDESDEMFFQAVFKNDKDENGNFLSSAPAFAAVLKDFEECHPDCLLLLVETKLDYWDNDGEAMNIYRSEKDMLVGVRVLMKALGILGHVQRILHTVAFKHVVKNAISAVVLEDNLSYRKAANS
jgi:hypothetical protein